jgi:PAP2 superfamily protein
VRGRSLRAVAWGAVAAAIAVPLVRRRLRVPPVVTAAAVAAGPVALAVAQSRSRKRDAALYALQMWTFIVVHELPYDDKERLLARTRVQYPIACDKVLGLGTPPTLRLQRALGRPGRTTPFDYFLAYVHWAWFIEPHAAVAWILVRHPERFPRAATMLGSLFQVGSLVYVVVPTAPPWWAAQTGRLPGARRIMVEVGERFWGRLWRHLYDFLGGNPVAAMPSLHFATSVMAARMLQEADPVAGSIGWAYAGTLGVALVHLGEHYAVDLIAGLLLAEAIRRYGHHAAPALARGVRVVESLEARARA